MTISQIEKYKSEALNTFRNGKLGQDTTENKYDVLKPWSVVKDQIQKRVENEEEEVNTCLSIGLQRVTSLHHNYSLHCVECVNSGASCSFITQVDTGAADMLYVWRVRGDSEHKEVKLHKLEVTQRFEHLLYIPKLRIFVAYCPDMWLHLYTDITVGFKLICKTKAPRPLLCLAFNCTLCHLVCGAYGGVICWDLSEYSWGHITLLEPLPLPIGPNDCVLSVRVDKRQRQMHFVMDCGGFAWDWGRREVCLQYTNSHSSALAHTAQHADLDYFITASRDGSIKVFTRTGFHLMYTFTGQYRQITGLVIHPGEPLLFSSSLDGTIRIWRLDTFEEQERVEIGEEVLGMMLLSATELACWTQHDIYIYHINLQHGLFNATQSALVALHNYTFPGLAGRVVAATEDGSIRFLCPVSGEEICIICPLPFHQGVSDFALDRPAEKLYCLHKEEVLLFEVGTNPCQPEYRVQPHYQHTPITCLTAIRAREALEETELEDEILIFTGHKDGMIRLLKSSHWQMSDAAGGHSQPVTLLSTSQPDLCQGHSVLGGKARLLSGGEDRSVCIWGVTLCGKKQIRLVMMQKIKCTGQPSLLCMLGDTVCYCYKGCGSVVILKCGDVPGEQTLMFHHGDENHTRPINGLACVASLGLFVSAGDDGVLKFWGKEGVLLREVVFSQPLHKVCFSTERGDVLLGYNNHLYVLPVERYLPTSLLSTLISHQFEDEVKEKPLPFDHSLPLWFDYESLPAHTLDPQLHIKVEERARLIQQTARLDTPSGPNIRLWSGQFPSEEDFVSASPAFPLKYLPPSDPSLPQPSAASYRRQSILLQGLPPGLIKTPKQLQSPSPPPKIKFLKWRRKGNPQSETDAMKTPSYLGGLEKEKTQTYVAPPPLTSRQTSHDLTTDLQKAGLSDKKRLPIAPDGYIPNSVVRGSFNIKPPSNKFPKKKIQLRQFPVVSKESATTASSDSQLARRSSDGSQSQASLPSEIFEESAHTVIPEEEDEWRPPSGRLAPTLPSTVPVSPSPQTPQPITPEPPKPEPQEVTPVVKPKPKQEVTKINLDKEVLPKRKVKERPVITSRQNTSLSSTVQDTPLEQDEDEEQQEEEVELSVVEAPPTPETPPPHPLLEEIVSQAWYPGPRDPVSVSGVVQGLSKALGSVTQHKHICDYIVKLNSTFDLSESDLSLLVSALRMELQSSVPGHREVAVKTLKVLGAQTQQVLVEMLPLLLDTDPTVKQEVTSALQELSGVENKDDLEALLSDLGMSVKKDTVKHEEATLEKLKEKVATKEVDNITTEEALNHIEVWISSHTDKKNKDKNAEPDNASKPQSSRGKRGSSGQSTTPRATGKQPAATTDPPGGGNKNCTNKEERGSQSPQRSGATSVRTAEGKKPESPQRYKTEAVSSPHSTSKSPVPHQQFSSADHSEQRNINPSTPKHSQPHRTSESPVRNTRSPLNPPPQLNLEGSPLMAGQDHHRTASPRLKQPTLQVDQSPQQGAPGFVASSLQPIPNHSQLPQANNVRTTIQPPASGQGVGQMVGSSNRRQMVDPYTGQQGFTDSGQFTGQPVMRGRPLEAEIGEDGVQYQVAEDGQIYEMEESPDMEEGMTQPQQTWRGKPRRRGNYTYFEWRSRSPRSERHLKAPGQGTNIPPGENIVLETPADTAAAAGVVSSEQTGEVLPCDMCGNPVQLPGRTLPRGTEDYSLYDQTYKYRRSQFGAIREWDEVETPEYDALSTDPHSPGLPLPPVAGSGPHGQLGSLRVRPESPGSSKATTRHTKQSVRGREEDSGRGTGYQDDNMTQFSTQLSSQVADADSGVLTDDSQVFKSRAHSFRSKGQPTLSPVRSHTDPEWTFTPPPENWREFFSRPEAQTRRHMEALKRQTSLPPSLPPISYVREDITIPGDPGIRLLQAVHVNNKEATVLGETNVPKKHRVDPLPGRLAVNSKQDTGCSKFGILNMSWTSGAQKKHIEQALSTADQTLVDSHRACLVSSHTVLPSIHKDPPPGQQNSHPGYQWATPLPPPPESVADSSNPQLRHRHQVYSQYYKLLKKRISQYISPVQHQHSLLQLCRQKSKLPSRLSQKSLQRGKTMTSQGTDLVERRKADVEC